MVFMSGLPGSGKSTIAKEKLIPFFWDVFKVEMVLLDCDRYFPDGYDVNNPTKYFQQTRIGLAEEFEKTLQAQKPGIYQTGGTLFEPRRKAMEQAMEAGCYMFTILVDVDPEIAWERNLLRDRTVEKNVFDECVEDLPKTFGLLKNWGAGSIIIKNN